MRTNLPKAPQRKDKAAANPRRNPTRTDAQQMYFRMKTDMWRQLIQGKLVVVPHESRGMWREAFSLIAEGKVKVESKSACTLYIRLNYDMFPDLDPNRVRKPKKDTVNGKFYLNHEKHTTTEEKVLPPRPKGTSTLGANGKRVWTAD